MLFPLFSAALAIATALAFEHLARRRGVLPPLLDRDPWRLWATRVVLTGVLWIAVFSALAALGPAAEQPDLTNTDPAQLFVLHLLLVVSLFAWYLVAFGGFDRATFARQLGLARRGWPIARELALGLAMGVVSWLGVIVVMIVLGAVVFFTFGPDAVPQEPPAVVPFIAGLPIVLRIALSLSAGVVEELFFRGFLQPRMGLLLSTACFALAHASYGEPLQLVAVTLLSLIFGLLVVWRRSIWAAVVAHAVFDLIQLLIVIPLVLERFSDALPPS